MEKNEQKPYLKKTQIKQCLFMMLCLILCILVSQAHATDGDVYAKGTVYNAATYVSHPSYFGHSDKLNVVDLNVGSGSADCNLPLYAPEEGGTVRIIYTNDAGWGNAITWTKGSESLFLAHLSGFGDTGSVDGGIIGYVGTTGDSSSCHLHIESNQGRLLLSGNMIIPEYWYNGPAYTSGGPINGGSDEKPDLIVRDLYLTPHKRTLFTPGESIRIYTRVKNIGEEDVNDDVVIEYYLSDGEKIDSDPDYIGHDDIDYSELTAGHSGYEDKGFSVPADPGIYNVTVCADTENVVSETDENNNCYDPPVVFEVELGNQLPTGNFEYADCDIIKGWVKDPDTTNPINIHIYRDGAAGTGEFIGSTLANGYRGDLPYDDKNHGFTFQMPLKWKDGKSHSIYVYGIDSEGGTNPLLPNSPREIQCAPLMQTVLTVINNIILSPTEKKPGDVNGDQIINTTDAILVLRSYSTNNFDNIDMQTADMNQDGKIGIMDAVYILQLDANFRK